MSLLNQFSRDQLKRYSRHLALPGFGEAGQLSLKRGKVLVVGAGGLGSPVLQYLTAAGVGTIGIIDDDKIELSNLQRQVLFSVDDLGKSKVGTARKKLLGLNPEININAHHERLTSSNALELIRNYDVIVDATDNLPTRYLINDACMLLNLPFIYGSIYQFEGHVSVFNFTDKDGVIGPTYRDLYPVPPSAEMTTNCEDGGVLGMLAGIIGSIQANEVIKVLSGIGETLSGRLFIIDSLNFEPHTIKLRKSSSGFEVTKLIDYDEFCSMNNSEQPFEVKEYTVQELKSMLDAHEDFQLIDVRTEFEHHIANIGGELIPLEEIINHIDKIDRTKKVVMYCKVGIRSTEAILHLQNIYDFTNLYNLQGGINAWATEIDNRFI